MEKLKVDKYMAKKLYSNTDQGLKTRNGTFRKIDKENLDFKSKS